MSRPRWNVNDVVVTADRLYADRSLVVPSWMSFARYLRFSVSGVIIVLFSPPERVVSVGCA